MLEVKEKEMSLFVGRRVRTSIKSPDGYLAQQREELALGLSQRGISSTLLHIWHTLKVLKIKEVVNLK